MRDLEPSSSCHSGERAEQDSPTAFHAEAREGCFSGWVPLRTPGSLELPAMQIPRLPGRSSAPPGVHTAAGLGVKRPGFVPALAQS